MKRLSEECGWKYLRQVTADSFEAWRKKQANLAARTVNEYQNTASLFLNWLARKGCAENLLRSVVKVSTKGNKTYERRAFSLAEVERLLAVAGRDSA
ncbi:MAG: hypothetical protein KGS61_08280 [Verrucomicrobia bacterium]|nr:hypothetical protein [Verrucomicrobiota bacterium]